MLDPALELSARNIVPAGVTYVLIAVLHIGTPFLMLVLSFVRAIRSSGQARAADAQAGNDGKPLVAGPACIGGRVEYAHDQDNALRVEIEQVGADHKGKGDKWTHSWTESSRKVTASPFFVHDPRGRVRIEPDERTLLVDKLDRTIRKSTSLRTRIAELAKDEAVYVVGQLDGVLGSGGAYREGERPLVMRNPPNGRLLVSTEALGDRFRAAMRLQRGFGIFFTILFIACFAFDLPFYLRVSKGHVEQGTVVSTVRHTGKGSHCELHVELPNKRIVDVDADLEVCGQMRNGETKVNALVVGDDTLAILGSEPGLHWVVFLVTGIVLLFSLIGYAGRAKPWYESKLVERGDGKLMESKD